MTKDDFDYQAYMRETPPDPTRIVRGVEARQQRWAAAVEKSTVRIDKDLLQQFSELVPEGQSCEATINQALREWLLTKGMKEMVRAEIQIALRQSLPSVPSNSVSQEAAAK